MVTFRPARAKDARAIRRLIYRVSINPIGLAWQRFLLAVDESENIIGCGQMKPHADGSRELASIAVVPEQQGRGIGREIILRLLENEPLPVYLTCRSSLGTYYTRFGFERVSPENMPPYFSRIARLASFITSVFPAAGELWVMVKKR